MSSPAERLPWQQLDDESTLPGLEERVTHPGFDGIQFLHVRAKSIINDVPEAAGLPFQHTINAYRGCTHACSYCLHGDTPILMADGCTKPLADIRPGDEVYGTVHEGRCRRYVPTPVLDHWATVRSAHQVTLDDGTHLIASGDHRLLTGRGWRHVSPEGPAAWRYAGLKPGDRLVGATPDRERRLGPLDRLRVRSIEALGRELELYDITTGTGDFIADGVVSHNCFARRIRLDRHSVDRDHSTTIPEIYRSTAGRLT